jgi:hypothetical protein
VEVPVERAATVVAVAVAEDAVASPVRMERMAKTVTER